MSSTKMPATDHYVINDGPRAHIIFDAAKYAYDKTVKIEVRLGLNQYLPGPDGTPVLQRFITPEIILAGHEDGSGQSLKIEGYLDGKHFSGYYHARNRNGFLDVTR